MCASAVQGWQEKDKNELINECIDHEGDEYLYESYLSAVILRYWGSVWTYYSRSKASGFTPEDCYSWLTEAIMYALKMKKWRNPSSPLFNDPNGPDKVINRCIYSRRLYYYTLSNSFKRKANFNTLSISAEDGDDDHNIILKDKEDNSQQLSRDISTISHSLYKGRSWIQSFVLNYLSFHDEVFSYNRSKGKWELHPREVARGVSSMTYEEFESVIELSHNDTDDAKDHYRELKRMSEGKLAKVISYALECLKTNPAMEELVCS